MVNQCGKMKLLLSSLLFASLCALSSWSVSSDLVVTQTPDVSVVEGGDVNITCCWTGQLVRYRVDWLKNQTEVKTGLFGLKNSSQRSLRNESHDCSNLIFMNIRREDSETYTCRVTAEIPLMTVVKGNGTVITVTDRGDPSSPPPLSPVIISLAVVVPLLLITLVCFCTLRRRQAQAARVIYEVPHIDSEQADVDKHSTSSSRGSSEWCQVPVYESFDYFERVETKESR